MHVLTFNLFVINMLARYSLKLQYEGTRVHDQLDFLIKNLLKVKRYPPTMTNPLWISKLRSIPHRTEVDRTVLPSLND